MYNLSSRVLSLLPYLLVFIATFYHPWDLDLGWHLRFGKDIVEKGTFPYTNTYSWELPGIKWFNSSWGLDVVKYLIFTNTGFYGYAMAGSIIAVLMFFVISKYLKLSFFEKSLLFPILLLVESPTFAQSLRGQTVSLLFLAILLLFLRKFQVLSQQKPVVPMIPLFLVVPLFFFWINLHAQVILGLAIFVIWTITYILLNIKKGIKRDLIYLTLALFFSLLATFLNRYGLNFYKESIDIFSGSESRFITEYESLTAGTNMWRFLIWTALFIPGIILIIRGKKLHRNLPYLVPGIILFLLSIGNTRFLWPMFIITTPVVVETVRKFKPKNITISLILGLFVILLYFTFMVIAELPNRSMTKMNWQNYCRLAACSPLAAEILKAMPHRGKLFSHYNYGGWLIWNYPEIKPSVDGRMSLWQDQRGYSPFRRFIRTLFLKGSALETGPYDTYFVPTNSFLANELLYLSQKNPKWRKIYRDPITSIYTRL